jgi:hypothetical protein
MDMLPVVALFSIYSSLVDRGACAEGKTIHEMGFQLLSLVPEWNECPYLRDLGSALLL